jgi:hypothetical protein
LALCWIPFAAIGWYWRNDVGRTGWFISVTLLISFAHQPLTIALVYGDKRNFDLRRRIFTWSPFVLAVAALVGHHISLTLLAIVAGVWNAEHTVMQRYGIARNADHDAGFDSNRRPGATSSPSRPLIRPWRVGVQERADPMAGPLAASHAERAVAERDCPTGAVDRDRPCPAAAPHDIGHPVPLPAVAHDVAGS